MSIFKFCGQDIGKLCICSSRVLNGWKRVNVKWTALILHFSNKLILITWNINMYSPPIQHWFQSETLWRITCRHLWLRWDNLTLKNVKVELLKCRHASANPVCADTKSKFSLDGSGGVKGFYQQQKSCCLCLGDTCALLTYQNPNMVQLEPNCGSVFKSIIIVATRNKNPGCLFMTSLPSSLHVCQVSTHWDCVWIVAAQFSLPMSVKNNTCLWAVKSLEMKKKTTTLDPLAGTSWLWQLLHKTSPLWCHNGQRYLTSRYQWSGCHTASFISPLFLSEENWDFHYASSFFLKVSHSGNQLCHPTSQESGLKNCLDWFNIQKPFISNKWWQLMQTGNSVGHKLGQLSSSSLLVVSLHFQ